MPHQLRPQEVTLQSTSADPMSLESLPLVDVLLAWLGLPALVLAGEFSFASAVRQPTSATREASISALFAAGSVGLYVLVRAIEKTARGWSGRSTPACRSSWPRPTTGSGWALRNGPGRSCSR